MTKRKRFSSDQMTLFEWVKRAEGLLKSTDSPSNGSLDIDSEFRAAISADIKACPRSRYQVAARMSELIGQEITISMLNNWTAEAHEKHRFPAIWLPAFIHATDGQRRAMGVLSRHSGLFALPGPEVLRAEIQRLDEEIQEKKGEKNKRMLFLREIEEVRK